MIVSMLPLRSELIIYIAHCMFMQYACNKPYILKSGKNHLVSDHFHKYSQKLDVSPHILFMVNRYSYT